MGTEIPEGLPQSDAENLRNSLKGQIRELTTRQIILQNLLNQLNERYFSETEDSQLPPEETESLP